MNSSYDDYGYDTEVNITLIYSPEGEISYSYDEITGRKDVTVAYRKDDDNTTYASTAFAYDDLGRLKTVTDNIPTTPVVNTYSYDAVGNRLWLEYGNGAYAYHIYNEINRLTNLTNYTDNGKTTALSEFDYNLAADGMRNSNDETVDRSTGAGEPHYVDYEYDNLNRIIREIANDTDITYTSGDPDNMTNGYITDYTYDLVGNRTYRHISIYHSGNLDQELHTKYTYDADTDRLLQEEHSNQQISQAIPFGDTRVYACADAGGFSYKMAGGKSVGSFRAFFMGLPSVWSRYTLVALWCGLALVALWPLLVRLTVGFCYKLHLTPQPVRVTARPRYTLGTRCISLLLAFLFIVGPNEFNTVARAEVLYSNLDTSTWAVVGTTIEYDYDANGSLIGKTTWAGEEEDEIITYAYNLQNRLAKVTTDTENPYNTVSCVEYTYNDSGIRSRAYSYDENVQEQEKSNESTTLYLTDPANPTGYAQAIAELTYNKANPNPIVDSPTAIRSYTIGDDILIRPFIRPPLPFLLLFITPIAIFGPLLLSLFYSHILLILTLFY